MDVDEPLKKLVNPDNLADKIEAAITPPYNATVESGSELFQDLGDQYAGRFIAPAPDSVDFEPTATGFTGAFVSGQGEVFGETRAFIGSVLNGQLQAGFVEAGGMYALGGDMVVDANGLSIYGLSLAQYFQAANGGETRRGYLGMNLPQGATIPAFSIIYTGAETSSIVTNGDFETGDLTGWTDTDSAWMVETDSPYDGTYCAYHDGTLGIFGGDLVQSGLTVTAGELVTLSFANRRDAGILAGRMKVEFLDSSSVVLDTEYIYGATSASWSEFTQTYLAPALTASMRISWESADPFNDECIDNILVYVTDTLQEIRLDDTGLRIFNNGVESSVTPEYPQSAVIFTAAEAITTHTTAPQANSNQIFGSYLNVTSANANDGDEYDFNFNIRGGTYSIAITGIVGTDCGKTDIYIDGVLVGSGLDWYSGAVSYNQTKSVSGVAISEGNHKLTVKVNGRSGSDYRFLSTVISIKPASYS